jgi:hypothetical protein
MPGVRHAKWCMNQHYENKRNNALIKTMDNPKWTRTKRPSSKLQRGAVRHLKQYIPKNRSAVPVLQYPRARQPIQTVQTVEDYNDDPAIGMHGTRFKRR